MKKVFVTTVALGAVLSALAAPAFAAPPVVLATPIDSSNDDNLLTVRNVTAASFQVIVRDVVDATAQATNTPEPQDGAFSFVAFGAA